MLRTVLTVMLIGAGLVGPPTVRADWFERAKEVLHRDFKRNNCWPRPFSVPAREATRAPFFSMIDNGWRRQNLLGDHYFAKDSDELTRAGALKIRWIMTQTPPARRILFVQRGLSSEQTVARVNAVEKVASQFVVEGAPTIIQTDIMAQGWPADYVDAVDQKWRASIPPPRLPEASRGEN